ncbi:uncharacterized protein LOC110266805 [Arachis ipaensis]|uniref:uncharacterized protein LOC110266805 n=1 Tax=Arachis ipaensis TaxID=130454 RepID=UPI000A2B6FA7|nr:uncharacterized protein LOC110266805 [Arachis ipaensis]
MTVVRRMRQTTITPISIQAANQELYLLLKSMATESVDDTLFIVDFGIRSIVISDIDYTGGLLPTSKASSIIEGEEVEGVKNGLSSAIQSREKIVLNVTSSGIASLLLPGGRTAHSRFSIPITITDESTCNIKHGSLKAELLIQSSLIIWDETPMLDKMCFETLDRTLRDLMSVTDQHKTHQPFDGKVVVLGDEGEMKRFANWILDVGNGNIDSIVGDESEVEIPDDLLITTTDDPLSHLVDFAYPNLLQNMSDYRFF